jgi:hypothetical protein
MWDCGGNDDRRGSDRSLIERRTMVDIYSLDANILHPDTWC